MTINDEHRNYLFWEQGVGSFIINLLFNAAIAWAMFKSMAVVPLWGSMSIGGDTIVTTFILPFMTCLIVTRLVHGEIRKQRFAAPEWQRSEHPLLARLPHSTPARGIVIAAASVVLFAPPTLAAFVALGIDALSFTPFLVFKSIYAGAIGAVVAPIIAAAALGDAQ